MSAFRGRALGPVPPTHLRGRRHTGRLTFRAQTHRRCGGVQRRRSRRSASSSARSRSGSVGSAVSSTLQQMNCRAGGWSKVIARGGKVQALGHPQLGEVGTKEALQPHHPSQHKLRVSGGPATHGRADSANLQLRRSDRRLTYTHGRCNVFL